VIIPELLTLILLTVSPRDGIAPLYADAKVEIGSEIQVGTACLNWNNAESPNEMQRVHKTCWVLLPTDTARKWKKEMVLDARGVWEVFVEVEGKDKNGKLIAIRTPSVDALTK
jgi:hypothetical protein